MASASLAVGRGTGRASRFLYEPEQIHFRLDCGDSLLCIEIHPGGRFQKLGVQFHLFQILLQPIWFASWFNEVCVFLCCGVIKRMHCSQHPSLYFVLFLLLFSEALCLTCCLLQIALWTSHSRFPAQAFQMKKVDVFERFCFGYILQSSSFWQEMSVTRKSLDLASLFLLDMHQTYTEEFRRKLSTAYYLVRAEDFDWHHDSIKKQEGQLGDLL